MSLLLKFSQFEEEFNKCWAKYVQLHKDLDGYRGQPIDETNVEAINTIVSAIQDTYIEMYMPLKFVNDRFELVKLCMVEHKKFMDDLKAGGAEPEAAIKARRNEEPEAQA